MHAVEWVCQEGFRAGLHCRECVQCVCVCLEVFLGGWVWGLWFRVLMGKGQVYHSVQVSCSLWDV